MNPEHRDLLSELTEAHVLVRRPGRPPEALDGEYTAALNRLKDRLTPGAVETGLPSHEEVARELRRLAERLAEADPYRRSARVRRAQERLTRAEALGRRVLAGDKEVTTPSLKRLDGDAA